MSKPTKRETLKKLEMLRRQKPDSPVFALAEATYILLTKQASGGEK